MTELEGCIRFWESKRKDRLLDVTTAAIIDSTIRFLKELQRLKGEVAR